MADLDASLILKGLATTDPEMGIHQQTASANNASTLNQMRLENQLIPSEIAHNYSTANVQNANAGYQNWRNQQFFKSNGTLPTPEQLRAQQSTSDAINNGFNVNSSIWNRLPASMNPFPDQGGAPAAPYQPPTANGTTSYNGVVQPNTTQQAPMQAASQDQS